MNSNISSLQGIVTAMQTGDYITSVTPVTVDGKTVGYTITFAKGDPITIYHGQDGADGKDGHTPTIGVKQDTDGIWYWTIDGEWLLDANGRKVKAVGLDGQNGQDGITPQLKIEDGYWYVSTDNGATWTRLGKATGADGKDGTDGQDGDSIFRSVTVTDTEVTFVTSGGQTFVIRRMAALSVEFDAEELVPIGFNATLDIHYTITSDTDDVTIDALSSADLKVKVVKADAKTGIIQVKSGTTLDEYSKVMVFVSNGRETITRSFSFQLETKAYAAPELAQTDIIDHFYSWGTDSFIDVRVFDILPQAKKDFIYPHMLTSYLADEWFLDGSLIYVIFGETTIDAPSEVLGAQYGYGGYHADSGFSCIKAISQNATIMSVGEDYPEKLLDYLDSNPTKCFMISCAADMTTRSTADELFSHPGYQAWKTVLSMSNIVYCKASHNSGPWNGIYLDKVLSENTSLVDGGFYSSASICSELNNKICVVGYDPGSNNIFGQDESSCRPIGFGKGNIVMPMMPMVYNGYALTGSTSSFPTASLSGTLGNFLSILMKTHPGVTLEGANTILQENYLREETFKYVDDSDGSIQDGGLWYFFDTDKFFEYEVLQKEAVDAAVAKIAGQAGNDAVALPSGYGICYTGPGVQFEVGGTRYDMTEENRAAFEAAWTADPASVAWYFSPLQALVYGASGTAQLTVGVLDTSARLVPDISRTVPASI